MLVVEIVVVVISVEVAVIVGEMAVASLVPKLGIAEGVVLPVGPVVAGIVRRRVGRCR